MKWEKLIKEFKNYLIIERNLSKNTVDSYLFDIEKLKSFLNFHKSKINPLKVNELIAKEFVYQISKKVKSSTQARIISGVKRFYDYIILEKFIDENPFQNIETPKTGTKLPVTLTTKEIDKIINSISSKSKNKLRNTALLEVLYSCGLRVSELITLKISDLFLKESLIKVTGKGNKERFVPISDEAKNYIENYIIQKRNSQKIKKGHEDTLFINERGSGLTRVMIYLIIKDLNKKTDIKKKISNNEDDAYEKTGLHDSITSAHGKVNGQDLVVCCMDFNFIGGSLGSVMGEKIARSADYCLKHRIPFMIISKSGGARMMESAFSLMQLPKTIGKISRLAVAGIPYISLCTDPTYGGTTASFAMVGDINIGEPKALIGFAGPRVIKETIKRDLPEGFQTSEFVMDHGFLDMIVARKDLKERLSTLLGLFAS